ncbi:MAG: DUF2721 domain-containing protein [Pegethrix bostrychoides GSE-TBD4-15B]|jgi:hypothetical protein|uniref:DUF2721 domain-containing protein n=1 Tax=Pegethrix bostrychoides GSE-TBD4-15B TaxID=2839662 RepID=A0A951U769_9CYAN|nr:DUF2721 domain-containing protein [Pegethrix bostrychoides GSE-TBD4-15B]
MSISDVIQTIQFIIAPVVLVTACAIVQGGVLGRFMYIGQRIRSLANERLDLLHKGNMNDAFTVERLQEVDRQIPLLKHRHHLLQKAVLLIYSAIAIFLVSMFAIALSVATKVDTTATLALICFLSGTCLLLCSVVVAGQEIRLSHHAICYEINRVASLDKFF